MSLMQKLKELIKLSNLCNFQVFASSIEGNIRYQKLRNYWVAKKLMSRTSSVKFRVFRKEFLRNHLMNWTQIFRENLNCCALSIFRVFILLGSSDSDKHNVNEAKSVNKDSPIKTGKEQLLIFNHEKLFDIITSITQKQCILSICPILMSVIIANDF